MGFFNKLFKRNVEGIVAPNQYYNPTTDDYEVIQGSNGAANVILNASNVPDSQAIPVKISGADSTGGAVNTNVKGSDIIQPVDIQARYAQTIQTHNAVSVPATTGASDSAWLDTSNFSQVGVTVTNSSPTPMKAEILWSNDGLNMHHYEVIANGSIAYGGGHYDIKSRYFRIRLSNTDGTARIMSSWAYLKA
jgi:hypothetical protein